MLGRPSTTEAAPYYFTYINQVTGEDPLATIEAQLDESLVFFSTISEEKSKHRYASDKWSVRQVLNHLTDAERSFAFRTLWFARGFETSLPSYEQEIAAAGAHADAISWAAHVEEFRRVRLATISLFKNMPAEAGRVLVLPATIASPSAPSHSSSPDMLPITFASSANVICST